MPALARIVLVDDCEADNVYHEIIIKRAGFNGEIVIIENGVDALDYLKTADLEQPTCIFLDINMPMLDGFEVAERAVALLRGTRAVIMMLTSSSSPADRRRAEELGIIKGFITKPLTDETVKGLLAVDSDAR